MSSGRLPVQDTPPEDPTTQRLGAAPDVAFLSAEALI
jgi:hypothetical protein